MRILVVEDELLIRMSLVDEMQDAGFEVVEASTADEAIDILESGADIRVVFSDIQMADSSMDGIELVHVIRKRWPPTILVVSSGRKTPSEEELPHGAVFLPKPYQQAQLIKLLDEIRGRISS